MGVAMVMFRLGGGQMLAEASRSPKAAAPAFSLFPGAAPLRAPSPIPALLWLRLQSAPSHFLRLAGREEGTS